MSNNILLCLEKGEIDFILSICKHAAITMPIDKTPADFVKTKNRLEAKMLLALEGEEIR